MTNLITFFNGCGLVRLIDRQEKNNTINLNDVLKIGSLSLLKVKSRRVKKTNLFVLTDRYLYFVKAILHQDQNSIKFVSKAKIELKWVYAYFSQEKAEVDSQNDYIIQLVKDNKTTLFSACNKEEFAMWHSLLLPLCIQTNFFEIFAVKGILGEGATAKVYRVLNRADNTEYACKRFKKSSINSEQIRESFLNEIEILRKLRGNRNIMNLKAVFESENSIYLLTELCEGGRVIQRERKYSERDVIGIAASLLDVLKFIKLHKVLHRDIKPANILLKYADKPLAENTIKMVDFGLSMFENAETVLFPHCGTLGYLPPEALIKNASFRPSYSLDLYGVGIILYNALTGTKAFWDDNQKTMAEKNRAGVLNFDLEAFREAPIRRKLKS